MATDRSKSQASDGATMLLDQLVQMGVDTVFGVPGGAISPFLQSIRNNSRLKLVTAAHEAGAAFMADGYARSGGALGVCLVTAGPGATNALTGVASAHLDGVPLLVISGQVPSSRTGTTAVQESTLECGIDTAALFSHATRYSTRIPDTASLPRLLTRALSLAQSQRGAVHLAVPSDVARAPAVGAMPVRLTSMPLLGGPVDTAVGTEIAAMLRRGKRPLFFLGSGARRALSRYGSEFEQCIRAMNVPVTTSVRAKGLFPESHPLSLGVFGIAGSLRAKEYVKDGIDTLIVLGSRLGEWATGGNLTELRNARTIVHVDLNPAIFGQVVPAHYALTCDAGEFIRTLHTATSSSKAAAVTDPISEEAKPQIAGIRLSRRVQPSELVSELSQCLRPDMDIYVDMGNCTGWAVRNLIVDPPTRIFIPTGLASMGWSCGAVIGGRIARPERQAVALVGDGAFLMNGNEVATAARHRIGVVYVVLDDGYLGMVNHGESWQTGSDLSDDFYSTGPADLPQFARSLGANVVHIESPKQLLHELPLALKQATSHGIPQVLVAAVNHLEVPPYGERFATVGGDR